MHLKVTERLIPGIDTEMCQEKKIVGVVESCMIINACEVREDKKWEGGGKNSCGPESMEN